MFERLSTLSFVSSSILAGELHDGSPEKLVGFRTTNLILCRCGAVDLGGHEIDFIHGLVVQAHLRAFLDVGQKVESGSPGSYDVRLTNYASEHGREDSRFMVGLSLPFLAIENVRAGT